jgi:4-hydroxybenzoate polyprenyltransferase
MRVSQWIKNIVVFLPIIFSSNLFNQELSIKTFFLFVSFCLASSFVYFLNDFYDLEFDLLHEKKSKRPLAAGIITLRQLVIAGFILFAVSIIFSYLARPASIFYIVGYILINFLYSKYMKHLVLIDMMIVASGYLIRVLAAGAVLNIFITYWLIFATTSLSFVLVIGKRRSEYLAYKDKGIKTRKNINKYTLEVLDMCFLVSLVIFAFVYILYATTMHRGIFWLTIPVVLVGCGRYVFMLKNNLIVDEPEKMVYKDLPTIVLVFLWLVFVIASLY